MTRKLWSISIIVFLAAGIVSLTGCKEEGTKNEAEDTGTRVIADGSVMIKLSTTMGDIVLQLDSARAPVTVANFVQYVNDGFFDGLIFHRVIPGFMIQGGGFDSDLNKKAPRAPIINEASNGLRNNRGTIAMARTAVYNSATSQFFINHKNNPNLDFKGPNTGYAVFGSVVEGMHVVDAIATVRQQPKRAENSQMFPNCPAEDVIITSAEVLSDK
jgi:cyclophilin family peptidyl-prolyl cis-trans isomerase